MKPKHVLVLFLKAVLLLTAVAVLAFCIFKVPEIAAQAAELYPETAHLRYPFLIGIFLFVIPMFIALYQGFKLLTCIDRNEIVSEFAVKALKSIEYCANTIIAFIVLEELAALLFIEGDLTPIILLGIYSVLGSIAIAVLAGLQQKLLKNILASQSEEKAARLGIEVFED